MIPKNGDIVVGDIYLDDDGDLVIVLPNEAGAIGDMLCVIRKDDPSLMMLGKNTL
jgi:hypothetical protein